MAFSWLQISDLHIYDNSYQTLIECAYDNLSKKINPDFLVITGDFCHYKDYPEYDRALYFLNYLVKIFRLKKEDVYLVPGNHDVHIKDFPQRADCVNKINENIYSNPDSYLPYMNKDSNDLRNSFVEYDRFIRAFYGDELNEDDCRITTPSDVITDEWQERLNIIMLNTALVSKNNGNELFDIKGFLDLKDKINLNLPSIILAHHSIDDLAEKQRKLAISFMNEINVKAYLCGDKHICENKGIGNSFINQIPMFINGKSVPQTGDKYSDITILLYKCNAEGVVHVCPYEWDMDNPLPYFVPSSKFHVDSDERVSFRLYSGKVPDNKDTSFGMTISERKEIHIGDNIHFGAINKIPIDWKILDEHEGKLLIFCTDGIANKPFYNKHQGDNGIACWKDSSLRLWLNHHFINQYIGELKKWIVPSYTDSNFQLPVENMTDSQDKVFLLSEAEVQKYLQAEDYVLSMHSQYCGETPEFWWLRTKGQFDIFVQGVLQKRNVIDRIGNSAYRENAVRPAMWIDKSFLKSERNTK